MESIASKDGESTDYEAILNELEYLQKKPLDLNTARKEDLQKLPFLTDFQIGSLLDYRKENGNLLSLYELPLVYGFTDEVISLMLPYVKITADADTTNFRFNEVIHSSNHEVILRTQRVLEKAAGFSKEDPATGTKRYPGNPWLYYARYGLDFNDRLQAGLTLEKDPGEDFFRDSNRSGFDYTSAYVMVTDVGPLKSALMGDFRLGFGQGLTLCNGTAPGKSALTLNVIKRSNEIKAFTSADENDFFRGAAASAAWGKFIITGFYSAKKRDANITDTLTSGRVYFSSFQESGYHRTNTEITDEKSVRETAFGGNITFRGNLFKVGTTLVKYQLDKYWEAGDDLKDIHDFQGNNLFNWGADYSLTLKKVQLFGETSYGNHSWATLNGALLFLDKYASFSLIYRNYGTGYFSLHSDAFSEGSANANEEAIYAGFVIHPVRKLKISAYADFYRFPWLRYGLSAPASGSDYLFQADYTRNKLLEMYFRVKYELDPQDERQDTLKIPDVAHLHHTGIRYHISCRLSEKLLLQNRLEMVMVKQKTGKTNKGFLVYQDAEYRFEKIPVILDFRFAWFHTGDYNSRVYAYEQDMTAGFSFSPLYDIGYRTYLMVRYDLGTWSCRLRFAQSNFYNKAAIGSGPDEIKGHARSEIKLQLIARF